MAFLHSSKRSSIVDSTSGGAAVAFDMTMARVSFFPIIIPNKIRWTSENYENSKINKWAKAKKKEKREEERRRRKDKKKKTYSAIHLTNLLLHTPIHLCSDLLLPVRKNHNLVLRGGGDQLKSSMDILHERSAFQYTSQESDAKHTGKKRSAVQVNTSIAESAVNEDMLIIMCRLFVSAVAAAEVSAAKTTSTSSDRAVKTARRFIMRE